MLLTFIVCAAHGNVYRGREQLHPFPVGSISDICHISAFARYFTEIGKNRLTGYGCEALVHAFYLIFRADEYLAVAVLNFIEKLGIA